MLLQYLGHRLETLQDLGVDNDTLVFFASDNGAHLEGGHSVEFFNSTGGLRGHKRQVSWMLGECRYVTSPQRDCGCAGRACRSFYEGGIRSPTLARWPGQWQMLCRPVCCDAGSFVTRRLLCR